MSEEDKQLKNFGFLFASMLVLVFGLTLPHVFGYGRPYWPFYFATALVILSLIAPHQLVILKKTWMKIAVILGKINGFIILGLIFYGMITPYAIILRIFKREPLMTKYVKTKNSYWTETDARDESHMETPY